PINQPLERARRCVVQERVNALRRGWQTGQVERHPPQQARAVGILYRRKPRLLEPSQDEAIKLISRPCRISHDRQLSIPQLLPGPMLFSERLIPLDRTAK